MAPIKQKTLIFNEALLTLQDSIFLYEEYQKKFKDKSTLENERILKAMRDSVIQRFEYCTDLFWKLIKLYLEDIEKVALPSYSPRGIIREAVAIKTISEFEGSRSMDMIENRNKTSHIYHEQVAESIAYDIPEFYQLMRTITDRLQRKIMETV